MSRFSQSLTQCLSQHKWTGAHLASLCSTQASTISRYSSGKVAPRPDALPDLLRHFDPPEQAAMLRAFLHDILPEPLTALVEIKLTESATLAEPIATYPAKPQRPDGISDILWAQVCRCAELARDVPEVAAIFAEFDRLIQRRAIQP